VSVPNRLLTRLFRIIEELVKWENSNDEQLLALARAEIMKASDGKPPPVLDPFCGGGSIPLPILRHQLGSSPRPKYSGQS
jgi:adenine-specific DNA methylase